ncbi:MAG: metalloregulator ArsR/SmtB family transcription factor [Mycobacteriales bacterium]
MSAREAAVELATDPGALDPERVAHARDRLPSADDAVRLTALLSLMADPVRLRILYALDLTEELCVGDLALALGANEDQVTYALRLLRTAGLVIGRKQGRTVYNRLAQDFPEPLREHCMRQLIEITRRVADNSGE